MPAPPAAPYAAGRKKEVVLRQADAVKVAESYIAVLTWGWEALTARPLNALPPAEAENLEKRACRKCW
ncbi:MAG: hypothetical protein EOO61_21505 [Hymenobacter sp.]|nr:MAG: hypothetical protein EOO61_21505 [Hymenobacter sp.]